MSRRPWGDPVEAAFHEGVGAVRTLVADGTISAADGDVLLRHLLAAYAARRVNDLAARALAPERLLRTFARR